MNIAAQAMPAQNARPACLAAWPTLDDFAKGSTPWRRRTPPSSPSATSPSKPPQKNTTSRTSSKVRKTASSVPAALASPSAAVWMNSTDHARPMPPPLPPRAPSAASTAMFLTAGNHYRQVGSDVITPNGNIDVTLPHRHRRSACSSKTVTETKTKVSGLTVAVSSPVITAIQTAQQMSQRQEHPRHAHETACRSQCRAAG